MSADALVTSTSRRVPLSQRAPGAGMISSVSGQLAIGATFGAAAAMNRLADERATSGP